MKFSYDTIDVAILGSTVAFTALLRLVTRIMVAHGGRWMDLERVRLEYNQRRLALLERSAHKKGLWPAKPQEDAPPMRRAEARRAR